MSSDASMEPMRYAYGVHPSVAYARTILDGLEAKTGRDAAAWAALAARGPAEPKALKAWLKNEHGLGLNTYVSLAAYMSGAREQFDDAAYLAYAHTYVCAMFASKPALVPLYNKLLPLAHEVGSEVRACPCKTMVPLYRNHVFAEIKPATRSRIDLGLALGGYPGPFDARLVDTGGAARGDRITHKIPITAREEIDDQVRHWLSTAYTCDG